MLLLRGSSELSVGAPDDRASMFVLFTSDLSGFAGFYLVYEMTKVSPSESSGRPFSRRVGFCPGASSAFIIPSSRIRMSRFAADKLLRGNGAAALTLISFFCLLSSTKPSKETFKYAF